MQYELINDVVMEREDEAQEWRPVPVQRLAEAIEWLSRYKQPHRVEHEGSITARIIRAG
jgi:hypothetical protein